MLIVQTHAIVRKKCLPFNLCSSPFPRLWCSFLFASTFWSHFHYIFFHFLHVLSRNAILKRKIVRQSFIRKSQLRPSAAILNMPILAVCDWLKWTMARLHLYCLGQWHFCFSPQFLNSIYYKTVGTLRLNF